MSDVMFEDVSLKDLGLQILNVPDELREGLMWAGSTYAILDMETGARDKAPRNVKNGKRISVTSDEGWVTFEEAVNSGYPAIGFRLTSADPYTVLDLDKSANQKENDLARQIYSSFDTYTELSKSGQGLHLILRGPSEQGRRKGNVEIYSQDRYIICTGNSVRNSPISDGGKLLKNLRDSLLPYDNPVSIPIIESEEAKETDDALIRRMFSAANGDQIRMLFTTKPGPKDDWSTFDAKLAQHICFYTRNHAQALRLFRKSALYRGDGSKAGYERADKYEQDYLLRLTFSRAWFLEDERRNTELRMREEEIARLQSNAISRNRGPEKGRPDEQVNTTEQLSMENFDKYLASKKLPVMSMPPGLLGEITKFVMQASHRPLREAGIAAALTMLGGISGRHFNIHGTGLGLYIVLLAGTGRGKESANSGISILMEAVKKVIPAADMFQGPSSFSSGQAIYRVLGDKGGGDSIPSVFVVLSEFGHTLRVITAPDANAADQKIRQALLDMFSKNSWNCVLREGAYADKANNTGSVTSPNLCLLGDTTPDAFFNAAKLSQIKEGFLPRFMLIEHYGPRQHQSTQINRVPHGDLVTRLVTLITQVLALRDSNTHIEVGYRSEEVEMFLDDFDRYCTDKINEGQDDVELWNRAGLKAYRIAGLMAVAENYFEPRVSEENARMAVEYVLRDMLSYSIRFKTGAFGGGDEERENELLNCVYNYFEGNVNFDDMGIDESYTSYSLMPKRYIYEKLANQPLFNNTNRPPRQEIDNSLAYLVKQGYLYEMDPREIYKIDRKLVLRPEIVYSRGKAYDSAMAKRGYELSSASPTFVVQQPLPASQDAADNQNDKENEND